MSMLKQYNQWCRENGYGPIASVGRSRFPSNLVLRRQLNEVRDFSGAFAGSLGHRGLVQAFQDGAGEGHFGSSDAISHKAQHFVDDGFVAGANGDLNRQADQVVGKNHADGLFSGKLGAGRFHRTLHVLMASIKTLFSRGAQ